MKPVITARLRRFAKEDQGSMSIELCIMTPILVWVLIATFVYFDLFRTEANVVRASVTIADMFSREVEPITQDYMDGSIGLLEDLTYADDSPQLRVTTYRYDGTDYEVVWSQSAGESAPSPLNDSGLAALVGQGRVPLMSSGSIAVLVETETRYVPLLSTNLSLFSMPYIDDHIFTTFTVVRPRFTKTLCYDTDPSIEGVGETC